MNKELLNKIKALMVARILVVSLLLGTVILYQIRVGQSSFILPISFLIAFTYFISIVYAILLRRVKNLKLFAYMQVVSDIFIEAAIIHVTGGLNSPLTFLYILSIISGSIILYRPGGYLVASISGILYGVLANLELYHFIFPINIFEISAEQSHGAVLYKVAINMVAFYIIAYLSGYLAENLRKTGEELEEKSGNLRKLKTFHENVVANMGGGLVAYDIKGNIVSFNRAAENITGYKYEDIVGLSIDTIFKETDFKRIIEGMRFEALSGMGNRGERWEGFIKGKDGRVVFLSVTLSLLEDDEGRPIGFICLFQDLTSMKEMESQMERSERLSALGRIVAEIAHDIRNPLASLSGSIQVLRERLSLEDMDKKLMDIIVRETESLDEIITDFIHRATPAKVSLSECDINIIIEDTIFLLKNSEKLSGEIDIELSLFDDVLLVLGDEKMLKQLMWNLSLNAVQAIKGAGRILIKSVLVEPKRWDEINEAQSMAEVIVEDSGEGIAEENLPNIFDPLFSTKENGTGLGLATVHRVIEEHHGSIRVISETGKGTKVVIRIPLMAQQG